MVREIKILEHIQIPRWCGISSEKREVHIFVDASDSALAAVAYIRGTGKDGITTSKVSSKCKVTSLRQMSIPRLELQAADQTRRNDSEGFDSTYCFHNILVGYYGCYVLDQFIQKKI